MRLERIFRSLTALFLATTFAGQTRGADEKVCGFSKPSSSYEQNLEFAKVLNQFNNVLDLGETELQALKKKLVHVTDVTATHFYYDPNVSSRYAYGYACEHPGLSSIDFKLNGLHPSMYSFCFIAKPGTLDEGELFVEKHLALPRDKWVSHLNFPNRDGAYGTFLRTTRLGAWIRRNVTGSYLLNYGDRYFSVFLSIHAENKKTTVSLNLFDASEFVAKQIDCERKKV